MTRGARGRERLVLAGGTLALFALYLYRFRSVPDGLVNDAAEEMLKGLALVEGRRLEVLTTTLGYSAETLWLYVMGLSATLLGPTVLAAVLPGAAAAAATVLLLALLARALEPDAPPFAAFLVATGSPWLFHYARSGLRVTAVALACAAAALLVARASRAGEGARAWLLAGAVSALGAYVYTTGRALPLAVLAAAAWRALRAPDASRAAARRDAAAALLGVVVVSLPNLALLARRPGEFLDRGRYVYVGGAADRVANVRATLAVPFGYPDAYRGQAGTGATFDADGVSATFTAAGLDPIPWWSAMLSAWGLVLVLRRHDAPAVFLVALFGVALLVLAPAGPSLSRLLVLAPVLLAWAGLGAADLSKRAPWRLAVPLALALAGAWAIAGYVRALSGPTPPPFVARSATALGERARAAAADGPVLCVVSRDASVVRYLAHGTPTRVVEFFGRPFDAREVAALLPARTLLVERTPLLDPFAPPGWTETGPRDDRFRELAAIPKSGP